MNLKRWRLSLKGLNHKDPEAQEAPALANKDLILTKVLLPINLIQTSRDLAAPVLLRILVLTPEDPVPLRIPDPMDPPAKDQDLQEVFLPVALHQAAIHWQPEVPLQASKLPATTCSETAEYKTSPNREICNRRAQQSTQ